MSFISRLLHHIFCKSAAVKAVKVFLIFLIILRSMIRIRRFQQVPDVIAPIEIRTTQGADRFNFSALHLVVPLEKRIPFFQKRKGSFITTW